MTISVSQVDENKYLVRWDSAEILIYRKGEAVHLRIQSFPLFSHTVEEFMEFLIFQRRAVELAVKLKLGEEITI